MDFVFARRRLDDGHGRRHRARRAAARARSAPTRRAGAYLGGQRDGACAPAPPPLLEAASSHTYYGAEPRAARRVDPHRRRRDHRPDGPQRHGQDHADPHPARPGARRARRGAASTATRLTRRAAVRDRPARHRLRAGGTRHLRQPQRAREPGAWPSAAGHATAGATGPRARARDCSRAWPSGSRNGGDQLSGGEQQMLAIGRALMTNPRPADPRRGHRRPGAADRARDLAAPSRSIRATGMATLIVDKTVAAVTAIADRIVILVKGEVGLRGHAGRAEGQPRAHAPASGCVTPSRRRAPTQVAGSHDPSRRANRYLSPELVGDGPARQLCFDKLSTGR